MPSKASSLGNVEKGFGSVSAVFSFIGGLALFSLLGVTVISVLWRYIFRDPISGIEDISTMALSVILSSGIAYAAIHSAHICLEFVTALGGRNLTRYTDVIVRILGILITLITAYSLASKGACGAVCGALTPNLSISHTPFYYTLSAAMFVYMTVLVCQLIARIKHWPNDEIS